MDNWNVRKFEMRRARGLVEKIIYTKSVRKKKGPAIEDEDK